MFRGMSIHSIDAKGRIVLPAKFREELGETFMVTSGFYDCIQILSNEEFEKLCNQINGLPLDKALSLQYIFTVSAEEVSPNAQGRIQLPQSLRESAGLTKEAVVMGMDKRIEIWDKEKYEKFVKVQKETLLTEAMGMLKL